MIDHLVDGGITNLKQAIAINMHEIAPNVHLHDIARNGIVLAFFADMLLQPLNTIMGSSILDTVVSIVNESTLVKDVRIVVIQMVDNPVAKLGGEHLSFLGVGDDKTGGGIRLVGTSKEFVAQFVEITLKICFKTPLIRFITLMTACVIISLTKV